MTALAGLGEALIGGVPLIAEDVKRQQRSLSLRVQRPWLMPDRPWMLAQTWRDTLFAHWRVPYAALREIVPSPIPLDTWEGETWIGVTPFEVTGFRMRGTVPLPVVSSFPELNVRTYVTLDGKPGIWFFSLDAGSRIAVMGARRTHRIPYFKARMSIERNGGSIRYESHRMSPDGPPADFRADYRPVGDTFYAEPGTLDHWLTERYCHYTVDDRHDVLRGDIHHGPWPLHAAEADIELNTMTEPYGIVLEGEPLLHYAVRQDTLLWGLAPA
jgi:uncharacterized protein